MIRGIDQPSPEDPEVVLVFNSTSTKPEMLDYSSSDDDSVEETPPPLSPKSLQQMIESLPVTDSWATKYLQMTDNGHHIAKAILLGKAITVSDGSYKDDYGTAAFVLEGETHVGRITGQLCVPGAPEDHSSHRSELAGMIGALIVILAICQLHDINEGQVTIGCDGQAALKALYDLFHPKANSKDFDLRVEGRAVIEELKHLNSANRGIPPNWKVAYQLVSHVTKPRRVVNGGVTNYEGTIKLK